jgi:hypothetical protein
LGSRGNFVYLKYHSSESLTEAPDLVAGLFTSNGEITQ